MQHVRKLALSVFFVATYVHDSAAHYYFDACCTSSPEIEQVLIDCAFVWDCLVDVEKQNGAEQSQYYLLRDTVIRLTRSLHLLNNSMRALQSNCSLDLLYYLHEMIKQISLEFHRQSKKRPVQEDGFIVLLLDLLDSEFERTYYYFEAG